LVEEYPELDRVYQVERQKLQREYRGIDRAKGMATSPQAPVSIDHSFFTHTKFTHTNWKHHSTQTNPNFWKGGDRVLVMAAGGAILGGMLAQIPGATIGAVLAGIYGWYSKDTNTDQLTAAQLDILRAIDKRPHTTRDLISLMRITTPPEQVREIIQSLWRQGYIDTVSGGFLRKFFPSSKGQSPQPPDPDVSLTLTSKGHFQSVAPQTHD
jgi:hypothetical protein